jgi:hypothetical protein
MLMGGRFGACNSISDGKSLQSLRKAALLKQKKDLI